MLCCCKIHEKIYKRKLGEKTKEKLGQNQEFIKKATKL